MEDNGERCCLSSGKKRACFGFLLLGVALTGIVQFSSGFLRYSPEENHFRAVAEVSSVTDFTSLQSFPVSLRKRYPVSRRKLYPDAIIIGVKKGGTGALLNMLSIHPKVIVSKSEVHFFDRDENYSRGRRWYANRMPVTGLPDVKLIEKTPAYFVTPFVPQRIVTTLPNYSTVKLILIVRDPVTRAISDYAHLRAIRPDRISANNSTKMLTFEECVLTPDGKVMESANITAFSLYDVHYQRWLEYFSKDQILVVNGDQLIADPFSELKRAESFLGIPSYFTKDMFYFNETKGFYCWWEARPSKSITFNAIKSVCLGSEKGRTHPTVSNTTIQTLREYFKPHMRKFCSASGFDYAWCDYQLHM